MRIGGQACVKSHVSQLVSQHGAVSSKAESRDVFFVVVAVVVNGGIGVFGEEVVRYCCISSTQRGQSLFEIATFDFSYVMDRASNVEIGVECQIFVIVIFFNCGRVLQFGAHSRYYKGAVTQKRSFLLICTTFRSDFHVG